MFAIRKTSVFVPFHPVEGGWVASRDVTTIEPDKLTRAENIVFDSNGARKKRGGQARVNASPVTGSNPVRYIRDFWASDGTQKRVMISNGAVYKDDADGVWDTISGATVPNESDQITAEIFNDTFIFCSSSEIAPQKWKHGDATTADLGGSPPAGKYIRKHLSRLWISGDASNPHRLYYSQVFDHQVA